jgi:hypothetical protein
LVKVEDIRYVQEISCTVVLSLYNFIFVINECS